MLLCPSRYADKQLADSMFGRGDYMGTSNLFAKAMSLADVRDGESQTFAAGEIKSDHAWALPGTGTAGNGPNSGSYGSEHTAGAHFVFCDGAVRFISDSIDENTFNALATPRGNDKVGEFQLHLSLLSVTGLFGPLRNGDLPEFRKSGFPRAFLS